jgi:DNA repair protein SbcD/Mre11
LGTLGGGHCSDSRVPVPGLRHLGPKVRRGRKGETLTSFRFLHAADIHLDSPLRGLAGYDEPAAERIRTATRDAFDNLVTRAIEEAVSFLIIAGDLYDGEWRDYQTGLFFIAQMGRLNQAGIPVYILYGNHDAESGITPRLILPENVKSFSARKPETRTLKAPGVALHGQSFPSREVTDSLVREYPDPVSGLFNIGVLHTGLGGLGDHANYAPCSLDDLVRKGYDYWALGHVHQGRILHERPHVVFPGNLQGRHIREVGPKGASLVTVEDREVTGVSRVFTDVVRWTSLPVAVEACSGMNDVTDRIREAVEEAVASEADGRLLACRIVLSGRSEIHEKLIVSTDHLHAEARGAALALGEGVAWVERVVVGTQPMLDPESLRNREDAFGELERILETAGTDTDLLELFEADIGELTRKLPHELRTEAEDSVLKAAIDGDYAGLIGKVGPFLRARITEEGRSS